MPNKRFSANNLQISYFLNNQVSNDYYSPMLYERAGTGEIRCLGREKHSGAVHRSAVSIGDRELSSAESRRSKWSNHGRWHHWMLSVTGLSDFFPLLLMLVTTFLLMAVIKGGDRCAARTGLWVVGLVLFGLTGLQSANVTNRWQLSAEEYKSGGEGTPTTGNRYSCDV